MYGREISRQIRCTNCRLNVSSAMGVCPNCYAFLPDVNDGTIAFRAVTVVSEIVLAGTVTVMQFI